MMMRVLHVFDTAGVASLLNKGLNERDDIVSRVITRKSSSRFNYSEYYHVEVVGGSKYYFMIRLVIRLLLFRPHIVHIHYWLRGIKLVNIIRKGLLRRTKVVFHAHGSDVRGSNVRLDELPVDSVIVATKDLHVKGTHFLPNPVDRDLFYPEEKKKGSALFVRVPPVDKLEQAKEYAAEHGLELEVVDRIEGKGVPYPEFASKLRSVEYFLDMKGLTSKKVLSKSGLEALASGCKVVTDDGYLHTKTMEDPVDKLLEIYRSLFEEGR